MDDSGERARRREYTRPWREGLEEPDAEWLHEDEDGFSYWPGRLGQHVSVEEISEGRLSWRWLMPVVRDVTRADLAPWLCLRLNEVACGWSFVFDERTSSIIAVSGMSAPPTWDRFLLRFQHGAQLAGWFCDVVADDLARAAGGTPAFSAPPGRDDPRTTPDVRGYLATALRERPEWVSDPLPYRFGPIEDIATTFATGMGEAVGRTDLADDGFMITSFDGGDQVSSRLILRFDEHPLLGMACRIDLALPGVPAAAHAAIAGRAAMGQYLDPGTNLMGAWVAEDDSLVYRQWVATDELRGYERLPSFDGYTPGLLWGVASTASAAAEWAGGAEAASVPGTPEPADLEESLGAVLAPLWTGERGLPAVPHTAGDAADRRLLWWPQLAVLLAAGWFNPLGPTLSTLELRRDPVGGIRLVLLRRHPLLPRYVDLGPCQNDGELAVALGDGIAGLAEGSLPNVVSVAPCPPDLVDAVVEAFRAALEADDDMRSGFAGTAARIRETLGQPWAFAGGQRDDRFDAEIATRPPIGPDAGFEEWLRMAGDPLNLAANLSALPDAWDGAINVQRSVGGLDSGAFDVGPYVLTYSSIGLSEPGTAG